MHLDSIFHIVELLYNTFQSHQISCFSQLFFKQNIMVIKVHFLAIMWMLQVEYFKYDPFNNVTSILSPSLCFFVVASYVIQPDALPTVVVFPPADSSEKLKNIHASPPYSRVAVVIEGAGLHRLWGGLSFGRVWEAADVCVGQDVCKSSPGSCFSDHSHRSLAAATALNAKHTDRHNLSVLTASLTHKAFVNIICRHV